MAASAKNDKKKKGILDSILDSEKPRIVNKWDGNAIKNALDDVVRKFFTETLGFEESHAYIDIRLALSGAGCAIALSALAYDYLFPYPASKYVVLTCVITYFILMSILTVFTGMVEKNYILVAMEKDKAGLDPSNTWKIGTTLQRFDHMFNLTIEYQDGKTKEIQEVDLKQSVSKWIDEDGLLLANAFESDIKNLKNSLTGEKKDQ
eukprot:gene10527-19254_t